VKSAVFKVAAALLGAVALAGCVNSGAGGMQAKPSIPSYPALTGKVDTSARLAVYGTVATQRDFLCSSLNRAGHEIAARGVAGGGLRPPDLIVDITGVDSTLSASGGKTWVTTRVSVRVRKPMKAPVGAAPVVDAGETFEAWAQGMADGAPTYDTTTVPYAVRYPKAERKLFEQACRNLLTLAPFRRALERK